MSKPTPTPGPWTFSRWNEFGDMRFYIAQADGAPHTPQLSDVATLIAETPSNEWQSIQEANARLIATAPEMLEMLGIARNYIEATVLNASSQKTRENYSGCLRRIDAVLAKATGEQP